MRMHLWVGRNIRKGRETMLTLQMNGDQCRMKRFLRVMWNMFRRCIGNSDGVSPSGQQRSGHCEDMKPVPRPDIRRRLAEAVVCLERLEAERERRGDSRFEKTAEERIVWSELIEMEMQEIDEHLSRSRSSAPRGTWTPAEGNLPKGGPHGRDDE
jgi:hypothetical protein